MKHLILYMLAALAAGALLFGWGYRRGAASVEVVESVRTVPVYYQNPEPVRVTNTTRNVVHPVFLFAPADTIREKPVFHHIDSVELVVDIERQEYGGRDTTFFAVVSGPALGGFRPRLERLELYAAERVRTSVIRKPSRWEIGIDASANLRNQWAGLTITRNFGPVSLSGTAGYDPFRREPVLEIRGRVPIFRTP